MIRWEVFLSTPSARRATAPRVFRPSANRISIHALREEGDREHFGVVSPDAHFYPRPPRGGRRRRTRSSTNTTANFYPRPPRGGRHLWRISKFFQLPLNFYPRPPRGGRRLIVGSRLPSAEISIHALREEGDASSALRSLLTTRFLSTPSARRAT